MTYKADMSGEEKKKWEDLKEKHSTNRKERIYKEPVNLGCCNADISFIDDKMYLEIMPMETADMEATVHGLIVEINEDECHCDSVMKMVSNACQVREAKEKGSPIKKFYQRRGLKIY